MDNFDRYFQMLRLFLPKDQRDDILRELSEEIREHVAGKEAGLGRPLSPDEQAAVIGQYGHPLLIATRYRPQRSLIGPVIFPYYWLVLKVVISLMAAGHFISAIVLLAGGAPVAQVGPIVRDLVEAMLRVVGWITLLAAAVDTWLTRSRVLEKWDPAAMLSPSRVAGNAVHSSPSIGHFVVSVVLSAWWLLGLRFPFLFFGSGAGVDFGPMVDRLYPMLVIGQVTMLAEQLAGLARPHRTGFRRAARIVWMVSGWALLFLLVTSREWQWFVRMGALGEGTRVIEVVNYAISLVVILVVFASTMSAVHTLWRRFAGSGPTAAPV